MLSGSDVLTFKQILISQIKVEKTNVKWVSSLMIGVIECNPDKMNFPLNVFTLKDPLWVVSNNSIYKNRKKVSYLNFNNLQCKMFFA